MTPLHKNVWLWAFLVGIVTITLTRPLLRRIPEAPPVLARLPPFELVEASGGRLGLADLEGSVWVVGFFAAGGEEACAGLIDSMGDLGRRYDETGVAEVRLLGIGRDPAGANAAALAEFGTRHGLAHPRWSLATGSPEETASLVDALARATGELAAATGERASVTSGLAGASGEQTGAPAGQADPDRAPLPCRLFLVDGSGGVRGAYRDDTLGLDELFHRSQHVVDASSP